MNTNIAMSNFPRTCWRLFPRSTMTRRRAPWNCCGRRSGEAWESLRFVEYSTFSIHVILTKDGPESGMGALWSSRARTPYSPLQVSTYCAPWASTDHLFVGDQSIMFLQDNKWKEGFVHLTFIWIWRFGRSSSTPSNTGVCFDDDVTSHVSLIHYFLAFSTASSMY